jgi:hypothetical protein
VDDRHTPRKAAVEKIGDLRCQRDLGDEDKSLLVGGQMRNQMKIDFGFARSRDAVKKKWFSRRARVKSVADNGIEDVSLRGGEVRWRIGRGKWRRAF